MHLLHSGQADGARIVLCLDGNQFPGLFFDQQDVHPVVAACLGGLRYVSEAAEQLAQKVLKGDAVHGIQIGDVEFDQDAVGPGLLPVAPDAVCDHDCGRYTDCKQDGQEAGIRRHVGERRYEAGDEPELAGRGAHRHLMSGLLLGGCVGYVITCMG